ncbi:hypothetical protein DFJ74DRAFT_693858 [Hyaloraphidium curvatum]|nr:hypothetical protein DFJ74DRAFT_693858 [Hyaloraphidium curvatum]
MPSFRGSGAPLSLGHSLHCAASQSTLWDEVQGRQKPRQNVQKQGIEYGVMFSPRPDRRPSSIPPPAGSPRRARHLQRHKVPRRPEYRPQADGHGETSDNDAPHRGKRHHEPQEPRPGRPRRGDEHLQHRIVPPHPRDELRGQAGAQRGAAELGSGFLVKGGDGVDLGVAHRDVHEIHEEDVEEEEDLHEDVERNACAGDHIDRDADKDRAGKHGRDDRVGREHGDPALPCYCESSVQSLVGLRLAGLVIGGSGSAMASVQVAQKGAERHRHGPRLDAVAQLQQGVAGRDADEGHGEEVREDAQDREHAEGAAPRRGPEARPERDHAGSGGEEHESQAKGGEEDGVVQDAEPEHGCRGTFGTGGQGARAQRVVRFVREDGRRAALALHELQPPHEP